jgi:hypothetical protein
VDLSSTPLPPVVTAAIHVASSEYLNLGYLAPDGQLDVPVDVRRVRAIRISLPPGQILQLQSIGIETPDTEAFTQPPQISASSWDGIVGSDEQSARLFDFDIPTGTVVRTRPDDPAWLEIRFVREIYLARLRVRNVSDETARQARGLKITVNTRWRTRTVYDGRAHLRAWRRHLKVATGAGAVDDDALTLLGVLDLTVRGEYPRAHRSLAANISSVQIRRSFQDEVNVALLPLRGLEWTVHGPQRPFHSWSRDEQLDYVRESARLVQELQSLTPNVCLGFGSVLSVMREKALVPHDDDLDLIVGFEAAEAPTLSDGLRVIEEFLRQRGYEVDGAFAAHRHVRRAGRKRLDVFVGIFEGETISWYPGPRGELARTIVFPARVVELMGVPCRIPAKPEDYLECVYGIGWRTPDPHFSHAWNLALYADILGSQEAPHEDQGGAWIE